MSDKEVYKTDSATIANVLSSLSNTRSSISNPVTGIGTSRDPGEFIQVASSHRLSRRECNDLYSNSGIIQNLVDVYPTEASWASFNFGSTNRYRYGADTDKAETYFKSFRNESLHTSFVKASIEARLHGEAYLLLGVEDGQNYSKPINEDLIESFEEVKVLTKYEVRPYDPSAPVEDNFYYLNENETSTGIIKSYTSDKYWNDNPNFYKLTLNRPLEGKKVKDLIIHKSRILKFYGKWLPASVLKDVRRHDSVIQSAYNAFVSFEESIKNASVLLRDHSFFWYALDNLGALVKSKNFDAIYNRFLTIQMSKNVLQGIAIDRKTEEVGWSERNLSNVDKLIDVFTNYLVADSKMVRYKILGSSQDKGLGGEGRGIQERLQHSLNLRKWVEFHWSDNLFYCLKLALKAKNGFTQGRMPKDISIYFQPVYELTPLEIVEIQERTGKFASEAIATKVLSPLEVRYSLYGKTDPVIVPTFTLDERYSEKLENEQYIEPINSQENTTGIIETDNSEKTQLQNLDAVSAPNYRKSSSGIFDCASCKYGLFDNNELKQGFINCDKYKFITEPNSLCDTYQYNEKLNYDSEESYSKNLIKAVEGLSDDDVKRINKVLAEFELTDDVINNSMESLE